MAVVYKAEDAILGRKVALKTLHDQYAEDPTFRRRFKQEARAMASLDHENIVKVYDISQDTDVPFIVAECVSGNDVGDLLAQNGGGPLNEQFTRRVAEQLLHALSYAHRRGIIHRDIKPSNLLITHEGTVKVADFGIARIVEDDEAGEPGEIVGSARYMSPEQLMGREATPGSDIYSVGILLYHCLTGEPPFSGDAKSLARQHMKSEPTPPRRLNRKMSRHMEAVILKALAKDPKDRYASANAMLDDLEADGPSRKAVGIGTREAPKKAADVSKSPKKTKGSKGGRRGLLLIPAFVVLLAAGGGAFAAGLVDVPSRQSIEQAFGQAEPVASESIEAPKPSPETDKAAQPIKDERKAEVSAEMVPVPDVRVYYDYSAREILVNRGFKVNVVYEAREGYADRGVAWGTNPATGEMVPEGSTITVYSTPKNFRQPQIRS